ncbi:Fe-S cluster assembly protein SufD [Opitutus terrae]|uniref:FeS assembly protein SufD n=1 Tax=Opitutus terrae (strain DSM 11246 / JCM 15787 / PB90-1) TaxID=452637 RepID=B2A0A7_OPITP|nr:Fe-S cluster assembly protein SufD [Opitutus terrae]ACB77443.1 FeS assembly protein SufD [Opitutus terrae PB90-1]
MSTLSETKPATGVFTSDAFAAHLASLPAAPAWWLERKRAAYATFADLPMPKRTDESWRFSTIAGLTLDGFEVGRVVPNAPPVASPFGPAALAFVNNAQVSTGGQPTGALPDGVIVTTLTEAAARHAPLLREHFMAQPQQLGSEKFAALHSAFVGDGAFIYVPRGVEVTAPIVVLHAAVGAETAVFPHTLVIAEDNAKVTVVDYFVSLDSSAQRSALGTQVRQLAVGANDLYAGHGAQLTYIGAQDWSREALSFHLNDTIVRRDARVQSLNIHLGGKQARHESLSQLQAPGAFSEMLALTVAEAAQEFDQRTLQIHQAPNTKSDLLYKNALRDRSRTIFSGLIIVDPDAQKTDAYQSNRNLMLSDDAEANSLPGLEIQANDVRCTHGATTSRIDPEQEFYLQSRGIDKKAADELLTFGFFEEVLARLASEPLHDALRTLIQTKFKK